MCMTSGIFSRNTFIYKSLFQKLATFLSRSVCLLGNLTPHKRSLVPLLFSGT